MPGLQESSASTAQQQKEPRLLCKASPHSATKTDSRSVSSPKPEPASDPANAKPTEDTNDGSSTPIEDQILDEFKAFSCRDDLDVTDQSNSTAEELEATPASVLSLEILQSIRSECSADYIVIDEERMGKWTEDQVRTYFTCGIAPGPPGTEIQAPPTPHSPDAELIRDASDVPTPPTVEFHLP